MNFRFPFYFFLWLIITSCTKDSTTSLRLASPDGNLIYNLNIDADGRLFYNVQFLNNDVEKVVIKDSRIGISLRDVSFTDNLKLDHTSQIKKIEKRYELKSGKTLVNKYTCNERSFTLINQEGNKITINVRMFDEAFAFRYLIERDSLMSYEVTNEFTSFNIPTPGNAWIEPYDTLQKWGPAHEVGYENKVPIGQQSPKSTGWAFPALFEYDSVWCLMTETGLYDNYCGSHLNASCNNGSYTMQFPWEFENYGLGEVNPKGKGDVITPWRIGIISDRLADIVESNHVFHLAEPNKIEDTEWIKPGRSSWSWWGDGSSPRHMKSLMDYVDLAAEMGWEYSLVDADWHIMEDGSIEELADYAKKKKVGLLLWYNSAGTHTKVTEVGPMDRMHTSVLRRDEFVKISEMGVKGVKVDFFQSDKQHIISYYEELAKDAADFKLLVNTHSSTIPRGWSRTYPNFLSMEAVKGAEHYPTKDFVKNAPMWNSILPFTRNVVGPMDYTPVTFSERDTSLTNNVNYQEVHNELAPRITTNAHELALSVIFECGIQHFADRSSSYRSQPDYVIGFLKEVPAIWDDTYFIEGYPGEYVIMARLKDNKLYIAGINGLGSNKLIRISNSDIPFKVNNGFVVVDGEQSRSFGYEDYQGLPDDEFIEITMKPYGGFAGTFDIVNEAK